jgi:hypothetical protein
MTNAQVRGASFQAIVRSFVLVFQYSKLTDFVKMSLGPKCDLALRAYLGQSENIGRENWCAAPSNARNAQLATLNPNP